MIVAAALLLGAAIMTTVLVLRRGLVIVTVTGSSMEPTYQSGDRLLARRHRLRRVRRGDVVLLLYDHPLAELRPGDYVPPPSGRLVKRVVAVPGDPIASGSVTASARIADSHVPPQCYVVRGDNPAASADSRVFGYIPAENILGVIVLRLRHHQQEAR